MKNPNFGRNPVVFATPDLYQIFATDPICQSIRATLDFIIEACPI